MTSLACNQVESLADLQRDFNALTETEIGYKAFYNQLAKAEFPEMMLAVTSLAIKQMSFNVLGFRESSPFLNFKQIQVHDGSSFALKDALEDIFPGRFSAVSPAAVELHTTMDLLSDTAVRIVFTPVTQMFVSTGLNRNNGLSTSLQLAQDSTMTLPAAQGKEGANHMLG